jgi:NAD(P)-dependent dehydrogenase (short-subunit alcohol dehydrogenase family)
MGNTISQFYTQSFPPTPALTEKNLASQKGKVFIVTGGYSGVGYQLASILFNAGGKVYIAGRSEEKAKRAIEEITAKVSDPTSSGELEFLLLELDDLSTIKSSVEAFKSMETKLDVLWNNAATTFLPLGSVTKQGHEQTLATNCLGPFLLTQLLLPCLEAAAKTSQPGSARVVWTSSLVVDLSAPTGGLKMADVTTPPSSQQAIYVNTKTGNWFLASEMARRFGDRGILSVTQNPGNLKTNILKNAPKGLSLLVNPLLYHARFGAYTELWAGLSQGIGMDDNGAYVVPWGRLHTGPRNDIINALKTTDEGGTGLASKFWEWCEDQTADYRL